jgi:pseudaminic acid synthase
MFNIKSRIISNKSKPFIIAEMSANHNGSLDTALKLVDIAAKSGADAIKLQTYTADTITIKSNRKEFLITDKKNLWKNKTLYELYKKGETPLNWHKQIFDRAKKNKIICFSSPFDETAVDFLEKLKTPVYKIASFENEHYPLLKKIALTGKPVIMSIGMLSLSELDKSFNYLKKNGCKKIALLKCTSSYPAKSRDLNILTIPFLKKRFKCEIGYSDHSLGIGASVAAVAHGATIIEKHFTLKRNFGLDGKFSSDNSELFYLVKQCNIAKEALGKVKVGPSRDEILSKKFKRSIYVVKKIKKGEKFTKENLKVIRPSNGLHPKYFEDILNKKAKKNIGKNLPFKKSFF